MSSHSGNRREQAAEALAAGLSLRKAAAKCKVPLRTLARWHSEDDDFLARVSELRTALLDRAAGRLAATGGKAAGTLAGLLASRSEKIRLAAAVKILELGPKLRESGELARQLAELEAWRESQEKRAVP
jgi:hypothetical protein